MDSAGWDERYAATARVWSAGPNCWVEELVALMTPAPGRHALDVGAGEGRNALWLAERGWTVTAVDFSQVALTRAHDLAVERLAERAERVVLVRADLDDYVPEPGSYDLVLVAYLHLPAERRRQVLARAADALAPGGTLLVVGHDRTNLDDGVGGPQDPAVLYTAADLLTDLGGHGLEVVRAERVVRLVGTPDGDRDGLDALLVAIRPLEARAPTVRPALHKELS